MEYANIKHQQELIRNLSTNVISNDLE